MHVLRRLLMLQVGPAPGYKEWLHKLRKTCTDAGVVLIFDEVYTGFRLHPRGAQGAYNVQADIVCYGKTLGGGLPIGVVCGPKVLMARGDTKKAARINYVIGTFAAHPFVMGTMNAFLKWSETPETVASYDTMHENIDYFISTANATFKNKVCPMTSLTSLCRPLGGGSMFWRTRIYPGGAKRTTGRATPMCGSIGRGRQRADALFPFTILSYGLFVIRCHTILILSHGGRVRGQWALCLSSRL